MKLRFKDNDRVITAVLLSIYGTQDPDNPFSEPERVPKYTTGVVTSISPAAWTVSGWAITWRSDVDHKERTCCQSCLAEVLT